MLKTVREHKEANRANAAANRVDSPTPSAASADEPKAHAERDGATMPKPQEAAPVQPAAVPNVDAGDQNLSRAAQGTPAPAGLELSLPAVVPAEAKAGPADPEQAERAGVRQAVVNPLLAKKRWSRGKWVTEAGVSKNSVYEYLDGRRSLSPANRTAMAEALDLKPEQLPE